MFDRWQWLNGVIDYNCEHSVLRILSWEIKVLVELYFAIEQLKSILQLRYKHQPLKKYLELRVIHSAPRQ